MTHAPKHFQIIVHFLVALMFLGGFLMDESDRFRWMETAREGVNQRGLDELSNSKRAHFEFAEGPLFDRGWELQPEFSNIGDFVEIRSYEEADDFIQGSSTTGDSLPFIYNIVLSIACNSYSTS